MIPLFAAMALPIEGICSPLLFVVGSNTSDGTVSVNNGALFAIDMSRNRAVGPAVTRSVRWSHVTAAGGARCDLYVPLDTASDRSLVRPCGQGRLRHELRSQVRRPRRERRGRDHRPAAIGLRLRSARIPNPPSITPISASVVPARVGMGASASALTPGPP
jgi:hypothetical protein